jgi:hypothetical protein
MNDFGRLIAEVQMQQALHPAESRALPVRRAGRWGMKRSLGATLVRLGLRLDPAAGERLGTLDLSAAYGGTRS